MESSEPRERVGFRRANRGPRLPGRSEHTCTFQKMASSVQRKRPRLEDSDATVASESTEMAAANTRIVLALCGSMSPITFLHLRMFGALFSLSEVHAVLS